MDSAKINCQTTSLLYEAQELFQVPTNENNSKFVFVINFFSNLIFYIPTYFKKRKFANLCKKQISQEMAIKLDEKQTLNSYSNEIERLNTVKKLSDILNKNGYLNHFSEEIKINERINSTFKEANKIINNNEDVIIKLQKAEHEKAEHAKKTETSIESKPTQNNSNRMWKLITQWSGIDDVRASIHNFNNFEFGSGSFNLAFGCAKLACLTALAAGTVMTLSPYFVTNVDTDHLNEDLPNGALTNFTFTYQNNSLVPTNHTLMTNNSTFTYQNNSVVPFKSGIATHMQKVTETVKLVLIDHIHSRFTGAFDRTLEPFAKDCIKGFIEGDDEDGICFPLDPKFCDQLADSYLTCPAN